MVKKFFQKENLPWILVSVLLSFCSVLYSVNISKISNISRPKSIRLDNIALYDHKGKMHELHRYSDSKAIVLIMHGIGCPIVRKSIPYINRLSRDYGDRGIKVLMVNSSPQDTWDKLQSEAENYGVDVPVLKDELQQIAKMIGAKRTMETVVIDPEDWSVLYHGALTDKWDYGSTKGTEDNEYVKKVLNGILDGDLVYFRNTRVKGCLIEFDSEKKN